MDSGSLKAAPVRNSSPSTVPNPAAIAPRANARSFSTLGLIYGTTIVATSRSNHRLSTLFNTKLLRGEAVLLHAQTDFAVPPTQLHRDRCHTHQVSVHEEFRSGRIRGNRNPLHRCRTRQRRASRAERNNPDRAYESRQRPPFHPLHHTVIAQRKSTSRSSIDLSDPAPSTVRYPPALSHSRSKGRQSSIASRALS